MSFGATLSKLCNFSVSEFPHLGNDDIISVMQNCQDYSCCMEVTETISISLDILMQSSESLAGI